MRRSVCHISGIPPFNGVINCATLHCQSMCKVRYFW
jgi:hypothetical protein